jgi:hypothetical protein
MKTNNNQVAMIIIAVFILIAILIAVMIYESGLLIEPSREELLPLVEVKASTNTPEPAEGWWDEKPTPVILE